jgi:cytochrome c-550 PedF
MVAPFALALAAVLSGEAFAHGDMAPQAVDTEGLEPVGSGWLNENPYRGNDLAVKIGASGYNANCARCHGLDAKSGGIAPDLRYLEETADADEWFINRVRKGYHQNGVTKMPKFEGLLSQEAMWAIRTYIDAQPE